MREEVEVSGRSVMPGTGPGSLVRLAGDQRGFALITALLLLAIMSVVGSMLLTSTSTEVELAAKYRDETQALFAADRAVEYAMNSLATTTDAVDIYADHRDDVAVASDPSGLEPSDPDSEQNKLFFVGRGVPPRGSGTGAEGFEALYYDIDVVGISPANATNPARAEIVARFGKIVSK